MEREIPGFIHLLGRKGHLWAKYSLGSLPQPSLLQLTPKMLCGLNSFPSELGSLQASAQRRCDCWVPSQQASLGTSEGRAPQATLTPAQCSSLPNGSPSSAMALMRLLARTCTCFPLVRL